MTDLPNASPSPRKPPEPKSGIYRYIYGYSDKIPWGELMILSVIVFFVMLTIYQELHK